MELELPKDYYLTNFNELIHTIASAYSDLLDDTEQHFLSQFAQLTEQSKMLYIRMLTRKGEWFRINKLRYEEIPDTLDAAVGLEQHGLLAIYHLHDGPDNITATQSSDLPLENILKLYNKSEWLHQLRACGIDPAPLKPLKREELDAQILQLAAQHPALIHFPNETLLSLKSSAVFNTFKLLYFGNPHQDLTEFVLRELGLYRFENYAIDQYTRSFTNRTQLQAHLDFYALIEPIDDTLLQSSQLITHLATQLPPTPNPDRLLDRRVQGVKLRLARQLERLKHPTEALALYQQCSTPPARERSARILVSANKAQAGLSLCQEIIAQPRNEAESQFAEGFAYRTARKHSIEWPAPSQYKPPQQILTLQQTDQGVEADSATHFSQFGDCYFVENSLFNGLFGLLYWQVIFAPIKGAFTNPFQIRPHDLHETDFLIPRQETLATANQYLNKQQHFNDLIKQRWADKVGITNRFVNWQCLDLAIIDHALQKIPLAHLKIIFQRIWKDTRANCSGFPDLILFTDSSYELIEIKGPGDTLQANQLRWMKHFHQHKIPHQVVHVEWRNDD